jgi:hypothetical protein
MKMLWAIALCASCAPGRPELDVRAPRVVTVDPADGATDVARDSAVTLCFDLTMQSGTLDASSVNLTRAVGGSRSSVPLVIVPTGDGRCFTLTPQALLSPQNDYALALTKDILSAAGVELDHSSGQKTAFRSSFRTRGAGARATLRIPAEGTVHAPLDLATIELSFSEPLVAAGPAFDAEPGMMAGNLSQDGLSATAPVIGTPTAGDTVDVNLDSSLRDGSGATPEIVAPLRFTYGACAEGGAPSVGAGLVLARDRDALLLYEVARPSLCDATLLDPQCLDGGAIVTAAVCDQAYDPCAAGSGCQCLVPLVNLCAGDHASVRPLVHGWNGKTASAATVPFILSAQLPAVVLAELMLSPPANKRSQIYLEIQNLGVDPVDLQGLVLADCHGTVGCFAPAHEQAFGPFTMGGLTVLSGRGYALLVDASFDATLYPGLPPETLLLSPSDRSPFMHLSARSPQPIGLIDAASGALLSSFDGSVMPVEGVAIERIDPRAPDPMPGSWALGSAPGGTPGGCNSLTPEADCLEGLADGG